MTDHLVDVGIPTRGEPLHLAESVRSVLGQTLTRWRLLISENGPTGEEVEAVLRPFLADPRVEYVATGTDVGQAGNFTRLVQSGGAPYVALLHDDDAWEPTFLARRVEFLEAHPHCGFVFSACTIVDGAGRLVGRSKLPLAEGVHSPSDFVPLLYRSNVVGVPSVVVRRSAYEAVGAYYKEGVGFTDHEMWLRLAGRFPVGFLSEWDVRYRVYDSQESSQRRLRLHDKRLELLDAVDGTLPLSDSLRRRTRAEVLVGCALDAVERGEPRAALGNLGLAIRCDPTSLVRPARAARAGAGVAALALGGPGRRMLSRVRLRRWRAHGSQPLSRSQAGNDLGSTRQYRHSGKATLAQASSGLCFVWPVRRRRHRRR